MWRVLVVILSPGSFRLVHQHPDPGASNTNQFFRQHFLHGYDGIHTFSKMKNLILCYYEVYKRYSDLVKIVHCKSMNPSTDGCCPSQSFSLSWSDVWEAQSPWASGTPHKTFGIDWDLTWTRPSMTWVGLGEMTCDHLWHLFFFLAQVPENEIFIYLVK